MPIISLAKCHALLSNQAQIKYINKIEIYPICLLNISIYDTLMKIRYDFISQRTSEQNRQKEMKTLTTNWMNMSPTDQRRQLIHQTLDDVMKHF